MHILIIYFLIVTSGFARLQVVWLRHFLGPDVVAVLKWLGLRPLPATAGALENALRVKVLILIAVAFKRRSERCGVGSLPAYRAGWKKTAMALCDRPPLGTVTDLLANAAEA